MTKTNLHFISILFVTLPKKKTAVVHYKYQQDMFNRDVITG